MLLAIILHLKVQQTCQQNKHILLITEIKVVLLLMSCLLFFIRLMVYQLSANNRFRASFLTPADQTISVGLLIQQIHLPANY